jgi:CHAT domain-containing protein/tetratricopeptide (TPR) repeat protein
MIKGRCFVLIILAALLGNARQPEAKAQGAELDGLLRQIGELQRQGRYAQAIPLSKRALAIEEKSLGPDHPEVGISHNNLALLLKNQGHYAEAEPHYKRASAIREKALGSDHPEVATVQDNLAVMYGLQGRFAEAEPLHKRALAIREKALGPDHPDVGISLNNLGALYRSQGRYADAEVAYKRALAITEKASGPDHPSVGTRVNNLAHLYKNLGRYDEAEALYKRALAIREKALGPDHPHTGQNLNNLAELYRAQSRHAEAEPLFKRALAIRERALGPNHPEVGQSLNSLASLLQDLGRDKDAEPLFRRALAISEKSLGPDHHSVGIEVNNLALLYDNQGRFGEAERFYKRALAIAERDLGPDHPDVGTYLNNLAGLFFSQRNWARAADFWRSSTSVAIRRAQRGSSDLGRALTGKRRNEPEQVSYRFQSLVKAGHRLAAQDRGQQAVLAAEMFQTAQWALGSEAAGSLAQMAARGTKGDTKLAVLVRERQDLVEEWQKRDGARTGAVSQSLDARDKAAETANLARLAAIDARIAGIDEQLARQFPDYSALAKATPLTIGEVQAQLGGNEALVLFLDTMEWQPTPEETFAWVVTKTDMRWVRSDLGTEALKREVAALRCGLDAVQWDDASGSKRCRDLLKTDAQRDANGNIRTDALPFDTIRAHALYKALFGQVEDLIRGKDLLIVPSGSLTQLPFQVLVTVAPSDVDYRATQWLVRSNALTVLPAVSSLKALRRVAKPSVAARPMLGVGNPLLNGNPADRPWEAKWAQLAREKQVCPQTVWQRVAKLAAKHRSVTKVATRGGRADLDHLKMQVPLHDTADELCAVAKDLRLASSDILLGAKATETTLKGMNLTQYRVLHFATHGTVAGEIEGTSEPGLILTPPAQQTELDDGYLSASEVAALKLDAEWVILSACNTAAGGAHGAEALSGLARAFIYAGARALLVSHWSVDSAATVKLITSAVGAITRDAKVGRAEALRGAMLALIDNGESKETHPVYWAPFVVVGEGAAR